MSAILDHLPADLRAEVAARVGRRGVSETAWLEEAVREKLAADAQREYLEERASRGDRSAFERVLAKVPATDPVQGDER